MSSMAVVEEFENQIIDLDTPEQIERVETILEEIKKIFVKLADLQDPNASSGLNKPNHQVFYIEELFGIRSRRLVRRLLSPWFSYFYKGYIFDVCFDGSIKLSTWNVEVKALNEYPRTSRVIDLDKYLSLDYIQQNNKICKEALEAVKKADQAKKELKNNYTVDISKLTENIDFNTCYAIYNINQETK